MAVYDLPLHFSLNMSFMNSAKEIMQTKQVHIS